MRVTWKSLVALCYFLCLVSPAKRLADGKLSVRHDRFWKCRVGEASRSRARRRRQKGGGQLRRIAAALYAQIRCKPCSDRCNTRRSLPQLQARNALTRSLERSMNKRKFPDALPRIKAAASYPSRRTLRAQLMIVKFVTSKSGGGKVKGDGKLWRRTDFPAVVTGCSWAAVRTHSLIGLEGIVCRGFAFAMQDA